MQVRALSEERSGRRMPARRESLLDLVGHTSLVQLNRLTAGLSAGVEVWVKLEFNNPSGSTQDRSARQIMEDALARGDLSAGRGVIDAAPANSGVAYAMIGAALGVPVTVVMPDDTSVALRRMVECFGAELVESSAAGGIAGAVSLARELAAQDPAGLWFANQYDNPSNALAHETSTAPEIWSQTGGRITHFVSGIGTGGTVTGTSRGLRARNPNVLIYGCRPAEADHGLDGLEIENASIRPANFNPSVLDGTLTCGTLDGLSMAERLASEEGIGAGNSAGAVVCCALRLAAGLDSGVVVVILSDHADRYIGG